MNVERPDEWNLHVAANEGRTIPAPQLEGATPPPGFVKAATVEAMVLELDRLRRIEEAARDFLDALDRYGYGPESARPLRELRTLVAAPSRPVEREEKPDAR